MPLPKSIPMLKRSSARGSITVFLALVLVLIFSLVFTSLEGARITGGKAYLSMLCSGAGDSTLGKYYYPLFEEYGLLAVDEGFGSAKKNDQKLADEIGEFVTYAVQGTDGGMIGFKDVSTELLKTDMLYENCETGFLKQVRKQAVYDGTEIAISSLTDGLFFNPAAASKVYEKQADAVSAVSEVVKEIMNLMELVDGVKTKKDGIKTDKNGKVEVTKTFVKKAGVIGEEHMRSLYGSDTIFEYAKDMIVYPLSVAENAKKAVKSAETLASETEALSEKYEALKEKIGRFEGDKETEEFKVLAAEEKKQKSEIVTKTQTLNSYVSTAGSLYSKLISLADESVKVSEKALKELEKIKLKQKAAESAVLKYAAEALNTSDIPGELKEFFNSEVEELKKYTGLTASGYNTESMKAELEKNIKLLEAAQKTNVRKGNVHDLLTALNVYSENVKGLSYNSFVFDYGTVSVSKKDHEKFENAFADITGAYILKLLGITDVSENRLLGNELPSGLVETSVSYDLMSSFSEMTKLIGDKNIGALIKDGFEKLTDSAALEVYLTANFSNFKNKRTNTKLAYEREYILFGSKKDVTNLTRLAYRIIGFRLLFTYASLLTDKTRNGEASALAATIAGFTGIPALNYVIKYLILTVWAIDEAIIETAAILSGKKTAFYSPKGNVSMHELLLMSPELVKTKVNKMSDAAIGLDYGAYVLIFSVLQNTHEKSLRTLDLIQENLRMRFRDEFRVKNCVTSFKFETEAKLLKKFGSGPFGKDTYSFRCQKTMGY